MFFHSITLALCALSSFFSFGASGSPVPSPIGNIERAAEKDGPYAITGVSGTVYPRLEVRSLSNQPEMWNLFLLSLNQMMADSQDSKLSWYQIGGIHGRPYKPWDGVQGETENWSGYCPHYSTLFGTWHRPYVALAEQVMHGYAVDLAGKFNTAAYRTAAAQLRFPYWDWAYNDPTGAILPPSVMHSTVQVMFPNGTRATIRNPLYSYRFNPIPKGDFQGNFASWSETFRLSPSDTNPVSQMDQLESNFVSHRDSIRSRLFLVLSNYQPFNNFANAIPKPAGDKVEESLEGIHNTIHSIFGNSDMQNPDYAAFDPIFFLHHCNVDRILAILQALWPNTYVDTWTTTNSASTYTIPLDTVQDMNSALKPFHKNTAGQFWTSADVRRTQVFGYSYPELINSPGNASLINTLTSLYGSSATSAALAIAGSADSTSYDYLANITGSHSALDGAYSVDFFLGDFSQDPDSWRADPSFVGTYAVLTLPGTTSDALTSGVIMLTQPLRERLGSVDDQDSVHAYLKDNLHWRVVQGDAMVPTEDVPDLGVTVLSTEVTLASDGQFPEWIGDMTAYPDITGQ